MEKTPSFEADTRAGGLLGRYSQDEHMLRTGGPACTAPDRLRWTSDFLDLASKAISVIACVQGLDYPSDLHRAAQQDLRAWAGYLDDHPSIAADFAVARMARGVPTR